MPISSSIPMSICVVFLAKGLWINSRLTGIEIMSKITDLVCPPADGKNCTLKES